MKKEAILAELMSFLAKNSRLSRILFSTLANMSKISDFLKIIPRAFMGAKAFEMHDIDLKKGRISFGGIDEVIYSSKFVELFHKGFEKALGSKDKANETLYNIGWQGGYFEVNEALANGLWGPESLTKKIGTIDLLYDVRNNSDINRIMTMAVKMIHKLITTEGGWGTLDDIDFQHKPIRISLLNSQESSWLRPSDQPVCYHACGVNAGYFSRVFGEELHAKEVQCMAMGAPACVFEIDR